METVIYDEPTEGVGKITLNAPDSLNAMSEEMAGEFKSLVKRLGSLGARPRAIVLTGAGRAFSAGGDLEMLRAKTKLSKKVNEQRMLKFYDSFLSILKLEVPLIAAINGAAVGAGLCLASACDIRIAAEGAKLGFTFVKLGLFPGMGATYILPQVLGAALARELLLTGRVIAADEAMRIGLVSALHKGEDLIPAAIKIATDISAGGPAAVRELVRTLRAPAKGLAAALKREALEQSKSYASKEFLEGVTAAIEKRMPKY